MNSNGVFTIALTGGPSGGKSTVQSMLSDVLENMGYKVYRVCETATILLSCGVLFSELDEEQQFNFQENLLRVMLTLEQTYFDLAKSNFERHGKRTAVICDRGAMDPSAYIDRPYWKRILDSLNLNEVDIRDNRYDMVVHLVSAADGAENFYSSENNAARSEGIELARQLDKLVKQAWLGHPHMVMIDNSTPFKEKCHRVIDAVLNRMGLDDKRWGKGIKKHKFLVRGFDMSGIETRDFTVVHTYLSQTPEGPQIRIRKRYDDTGCCHFSITTRQTHSDGQRIEERRQITGREYDSLRVQSSPLHHSVVKTRRVFLHNNFMFQLDLFQSPSAGLVLLEAYLPEPQEEKPRGDDFDALADELQAALTLRTLLPSFIEVDREVTDDPAYSMFHLAKKEVDRGYVSMV